MDKANGAHHSMTHDTHTHKHTHTHTHRDSLFSHKEEQNPVICGKMDAAGHHHVK
jgi:hypothetical protein